MRDPGRLIAFMGAVVVVTVAEVAVLSRWRHVVRWPYAIVAVDCATLVGALVLAGPGIAFYCFAAGCAALAGAQLGLVAIPIWAAQALLGYVVAARFVVAARPAAEIAVFVWAFPMAAAVCGIGSAVARLVLERHIRLIVRLVASAQRSAAASERARLARELHDSVAKTLRGVSFAALALPSSLRRHPDLAAQLADAVSVGAEAAAQEARQLVVGLRMDNPDEDFHRAIAAIGRGWSEATGIAVRLDLAPVEPPIAVRYELTRILHEALVNVERHAEAGEVRVMFDRAGDSLRLIVADDGQGVPGQLGGPEAGHFGIVGMSERAKAIGGELRITGSPHQGTRVVVVVPLPARRDTLAVLPD